MTSLYKDIEFENSICNQLGAPVWLDSPSDSDGNARTLVSAAVPGQLDVRGLALE